MAKLSDWIEAEGLKILVRHASGIIGAAAIFKLVGMALKWALREGIILGIVEKLEGWIFLSLFLWFIIQMFISLWNKRVHFDE